LARLKEISKMELDRDDLLMKLGAARAKAPAAKIEEIYVFAFACLGNAEKNKELIEALFGCSSVYHAAQRRKRFYCVFRIVVIPWNTIEIEERK
jgi:hypothetical protein